MNKRSPVVAGRSRHAHAPAHAGERTLSIALVDARYVAWLAEQAGFGAPMADGPPAALLEVLAERLRRVLPQASLTRAVWYAEQRPDRYTDDLLCRVVPAHDSDGGLGLVRSLGMDLLQWAQRQPGASVLIASDDERLLSQVDEAQWLGLKVCMLVDESALDAARMRREDPSFYRLLQQADRRVALDGLAWERLLGLSDGEATSEEADADARYQGEEGSPQMGERLQAMVREWWEAESEESQDDLRDELSNTHGIPPETDRVLLLRARREFARNLSFYEKKALREVVKAMVLAPPDEVVATPAATDARPAD